MSFHQYWIKKIPTLTPELFLLSTSANFFRNFRMTDSLGSTLRVLRNTGFEVSILKFIQIYLHLFAPKTIHIHNPNWKHNKNDIEIFLTTTYQFSFFFVSEIIDAIRILTLKILTLYKFWSNMTAIHYFSTLWIVRIIFCFWIVTLFSIIIIVFVIIIIIIIIILIMKCTYLFNYSSRLFSIFLFDTAMKIG